MTHPLRPTTCPRSNVHKLTLSNFKGLKLSEDWEEKTCKDIIDCLLSIWSPIPNTITSSFLLSTTHRKTEDMCRSRLAQSLYEKIKNNIPSILSLFISSLKISSPSSLEEISTLWSTIILPKMHQTQIALLYLDKVYVAARGNELSSIATLILSSIKDNISLQSIILPLIDEIIKNPTSPTIGTIIDMFSSLDLLNSFLEEDLKLGFLKEFTMQSKKRLEESNIDSYLLWIKDTLKKYDHLPLDNRNNTKHLLLDILLPPIFLNPLSNGSLLRRDRMTYLIMNCKEENTFNNSINYLLNLCHLTSSLPQLRETWFNWIRGIGEDILKTKDPFDRLLSLYNHLLKTVTPSLDVCNVRCSSCTSDDSFNCSNCGANGNKCGGQFMLGDNDPSPEPLFIQSIKDAFDIIMNNSLEIPSRLALYCRKQISVIGGDKLPQIIRLFRHLSPSFREIFIKRLQDLLAARLLRSSLKKEDLKIMEWPFLLLLKKECGPSITNRMEGMLKDVLNSLDNEDSNPQTSSILSVLLCTCGIWPKVEEDIKEMMRDIPMELKESFRKFEDEFHSGIKGKIGKKLSFSNSLGSCVLRCSFKGNVKKELLFTIPQGFVALQFNDASIRTFDQLMDKCQFRDDSILLNILAIFTKQGLLIRVSDGWQWNDEFKNENKRIKFIRDDEEEDDISFNHNQTSPMASPMVSILNVPTSPREGDEVNHLIDVIVVSFLKKSSNPESFKNIMNEIIAKIPLVTDLQVEKRIEALKEREFLKDLGDGMYEYLL